MSSSRGGQSCVLEDSCRICHTNVLLLLCPVLTSWSTFLPSLGSEQPQGAWPVQTGVCGQKAYCQHRCSMPEHVRRSPSFPLHNEDAPSVFSFFLKSAIHIVQTRATHSKLLAWGILYGTFYICLIHGSSKLLCLCRSGKLTEQ